MEEKRDWDISFIQLFREKKKTDQNFQTNKTADAAQYTNICFRLIETLKKGKPGAEGSLQCKVSKGQCMQPYPCKQSHYFHDSNLEWTSTSNSSDNLNPFYLLQVWKASLFLLSILPRILSKCISFTYIWCNPPPLSQANCVTPMRNQQSPKCLNPTEW